MAKAFHLAIDRYQADTYVAPIRTKRDIVVIWMETIKNYLIDQPPSPDATAAEISILIDSMSRLFCTLGDGRKIFSIAFPFGVTRILDEYRFISREGVEIDNKVSSIILSLIGKENEGIFSSQDFSQFIDPIIDSSDFHPEIWSLVRELMLAEDGYLRYDWDAVRSDGHRHPLHHLDVNYSNGGTFKVGLNTHVDCNTLISILDAATDCHYLRPASAA